MIKAIANKIKLIAVDTKAPIPELLAFSGWVSLRVMYKIKPTIGIQNPINIYKKELLEETLEDFELGKIVLQLAQIIVSMLVEVPHF